MPGTAAPQHPSTPAPLGLWRAALIVLAGLAAGTPLPPAAVEAYYSSLIYPRIQRLLTPLSNQVPVALLDLLLVAVVVWWIWRLARDLARPFTWRRTVMALVARTATAAAALYLAFLIVWGFNYRREPLAWRLRFDTKAVSTERALELARQTVDHLNQLHAAAHTRGWGAPGVVDRGLVDAFRRALDDLGSGPLTAVPGVPKWTLLDWYFRRAAVAGMTDPFFLETLVSSDLLSYERPAVIAHEWSHLAGLADEGEANFAGWLTCLRGTPAHQYSGWLFLYEELERALRRVDADAAARRLLPGPRADLLAVRERLLRHVNPQISAAGWRAYDGYLKANRVDQGAASYADVVRLILGVQFDEGWVPQRDRRRRGR